jgi:DNA (cytosine-5)-methyltransferase 1
MKALNLYAGIGGNRALWKDIDITAIEYDPNIAEVYSRRFPDDEVIVEDAHAYLEKHFAEFDFIWSSPPCPSHGQYRHNVGVLAKGYAPLIPDMRLYGEIIFLSTYFHGKYVVENTRPYYAPLIAPSGHLRRHLFWANFALPADDGKAANLRTRNKISDFDAGPLVVASRIKNKRQTLRNCVDEDLGAAVLRAALADEGNGER